MGKLQIGGEKKIESIAAYWDAYSSNFDAAHATETLVLWKQELVRTVGESRKQKILDVGTGTGFLALMLAESEYDVTGIDISEAMLAIGREKADARGLQIPFIQSTGECTPFPPGSFDAVVNCRVLWTLTEPVVAVREWMRVLKPGGKVISFMRVMDVVSESGDAFYHCEGIPIELPLCCASEEDYLNIYRAAGLGNIHTEKLPSALSCANLPPWSAFIGEKI